MTTIDRIATHGKNSEKAAERHLRERVKALGGLCLKYSNPNEPGYPDRLVVLPHGVFFFVELKSKGEKPRKLQRLRMEQLTFLGVKAYVCDCVAAVDEILKQYQKTKIK